MAERIIQECHVVGGCHDSMRYFSLVPRPWLLPSPDSLATQLQKLVLMGGVLSVLMEVSKILQALKAV